MQRRTEEYYSRGVYLPPSKNQAEGSNSDEDLYAVGPGRDRDRRGFLEEEASINISCLIQNAKIEMNV